MVRLFASCLILLFVAALALAEEPLPGETNSLEMKLVQIPAGEFNRGMTDDFKLNINHPNTMMQGADLQDERPAHPVKISRSFWLGTQEVTVGQFRQFVEATKYETSAEQKGRGALRV